MPERFWCPYLNAGVELTDERERHIAERHPDLLPAHRERIADVLAGPDEVRRNARIANVRSFARWFESVQRGKYIVVAVVTEAGGPNRHWIVTAYIARRLVAGETEWKRG